MCVLLILQMRKLTLRDEVITQLLRGVSRCLGICTQVAGSSDFLIISVPLRLYNAILR